MAKTNEPSKTVRENEGAGAGEVNIRGIGGASSVGPGRQEPSGQTGNDAEGIAGDPPGSGSPLGRVGGTNPPVDPSERGGGPGIGGSGGA